MKAIPARDRNVSIEVGGLPIRLRCDNPQFARLIEERYSGFLSSSPDIVAEFEIELTPPHIKFGNEDVRVTSDAGQWLIERTDFQARWNPATGLGRILQPDSIYPLDSVLRIVYTLVLARMGGFLLHASSSVRNGCALLFAGTSGAGKTAIVRSAPPDVALLSDDVSCVIRRGDSYNAVGTPFYCGLGRPGKNLEAEIKVLYLLAQGSENKIEPVEDAAAIRRLLENALFFANDAELVKLVFERACEFANHVPIRQLTLAPGCLRLGSNRTKNKPTVDRGRSATAGRLEDEILVMSAPDSTLFTLNEIPSLIWDAAGGVTPTGPRRDGQDLSPIRC